MPCCLWCLKEMPDARSWRVDDHLCDEGCRRAFRETDIIWLVHAVQIVGQEPAFDLGGLEEGGP